MECLRGHPVVRAGVGVGSDKPGAPRILALTRVKLD